MVIIHPSECQHVPYVLARRHRQRKAFASFVSALLLPSATSLFLIGHTQVKSSIILLFTHASKLQERLVCSQMLAGK